jgi:hypothetical protein
MLALSAPVFKMLPKVLDALDSAADAKRDVDLFRHPRRILEHQRATLVARGNVEEYQLVGALLIVKLGALNRVAGIAQVDEVSTLDDTRPSFTSRHGMIRRESISGIRDRFVAA